MTCPYLAYRRSAGEQSFDHERAFCTAVSEFVQPMRADICNDRHALDHVAHCEFYRDAEGLDPLAGLQAGTPTGAPGGDDDRPGGGDASG